MSPPEQPTLSEIKAENEQAHFLQARDTAHIDRGAQPELKSVSYFGRIYSFQGLWYNKRKCSLKAFETFRSRGRALFFSVPCGFGKAELSAAPQTLTAERFG